MSGLLIPHVFPSRFFLGTKEPSKEISDPHGVASSVSCPLDYLPIENIAIPAATETLRLSFLPRMGISTM